MPASAVDFAVMAKIFTPGEMARTPGISPKTLRAWLRAGRDGGHPLLAGHDQYGRWQFTGAEAGALVDEYRGNHQSAASAAGARTVRAPRPRDKPTAASPPRTAPPATPTPGTRGAQVPLLPTSFTKAGLTAVGFEGFKTWPQLRKAYEEIVSSPGVYVVLRTAAGAPKWTHPGTGGVFKGRAPSVSADRLEAEWVQGARMLYVGKAAARKAGGSNDGLRKRLSEYSRFGAGQPIGHRGGRLIWQLTDADELLVAWHAITWNETARDYERRLLARFAEVHGGRRPLANLTG